MRLGRPPLYDLTGQRFGALTVVGRDPRDSRFWSCKCDCGGNILSSTADLKHRGRKSCGCRNGRAHKGNGRDKGAWADNPGYLSGVKGVKDTIAPEVARQLGPSDKRACAVCGAVPGRIVMSAFGYAHSAFRASVQDVEGVLTLCPVCHTLFRRAMARAMDTYEPASWFLSVFPQDKLPPQTARGIANLLIKYQTEEESMSVAGGKVRKIAEEVLGVRS